MKKREPIALLLLFLFVVFFPFVVSDPYILSILNFAGINALVTLGLVILMGYAGQASLGQNGFFGAGAYVSGMLSVYYGVPVALSLIAGVLVAGALAILIAVPSLKLRGHYLAVATLAFGEIAYILFNELGPGGPSGFGNIPVFSLFGWSPQGQGDFFYIIWLVLFVAFLFSYLLVNSPVGLLLKAMHESEQALTSVGINLVHLKVFVFVVAAVLAGLAGGLYAHFVTFISPASFSIFYSVQVLIMAVVGGIMSLAGALIGAIIITSLPEVLRVFKDLDVLVYGLILTLCLLYLRKGLVGAVKRWI